MEHATIKLNELGRAKIHDEQGNEYHITGIKVSAQEDLDITVEAIETVEKVVTNQFAQTIPKPDLEALARYATGLLLEDKVISDDVTLGFAVARLYACLSAVFAMCAIDTTNNAINHADPETRPE